LGTFLGYHVTVCDARAVFATPAHALPRKRLSAATAYCAFQAGSKSPMVVRVNYALHALMTLAMIAMLFHGWDWPLLPQLLAFALAAWWFTVQASSTLAQHAIHRGGHPRGKSLHDAFVMAAMGVMLAAPQFAGTHAADVAQVCPVALPTTNDWTGAASMIAVGHHARAGHAEKARPPCGNQRRAISSRHGQIL
jgi:hypothetical protein